MFEFTKPPEGIREADHRDIGRGQDIYWLKSGISASTFWIVDSSDGEWIAFKSEIVPVIYKKSQDGNKYNHDWTYDYDNQRVEFIWLKKDEILNFMACWSMSRMMKAVIQTNRFEFIPDTYEVEFAQIVRENGSGYQIYTYDRGSLYILLAIAKDNWDLAETTADLSTSGEFHEQRRWMSNITYTLIINEEGSVRDNVYCPTCNTLYDITQIEDISINGECYECQEKRKRSLE